MKKKIRNGLQLVLLVEECGEEATQCTPQPTGRTTASRTLPKSERGPHAARDPRCAAGSRARVRAPGAAGAGSLPAHPSALRRPGGPRGTPAVEAPRDGRVGPGSGPRRTADSPRPPPRRRAGRRTYHVGLRRRPGVTAGQGGQAGGDGQAGGGGQRAGGRDARPHGRPQPLPGSLTPHAGRPGAGHSPSVRLHQAEGARTRRAALEGAVELAGVGPRWPVSLGAARAAACPAPSR